MIQKSIRIRMPTGEQMKAFLNFVLVLLAVPGLAGVSFAADGSSLKPPPGAKVAIVVFEDMECPSCARNYPTYWETAKAHHIPVVLHDFPLGPKHPWSFEAAVWARFFDTKSEKTGDDFRGYIFQNQPQINPENLRQYVEKFANDNHIALPFAYDPEGKLKAKVQADHDLGMRMGINQTPTIFIVSNGASQEVDRFDQLTQIVEDMQKKAGPATPAAPVKHASAKTQ